MIPGRCAKKTCELDLFSPKTKSIWDRSGEKVQSLKVFCDPNEWSALFLEASRWIRQNIFCHLMRVTLQLFNALSILSSPKTHRQNCLLPAQGDVLAPTFCSAEMVFVQKNGSRCLANSAHGNRIQVICYIVHYGTSTCH